MVPSSKQVSGFVRGIIRFNYKYVGYEDMYVAERSKQASTMVNSGIFIINENENIYRFFPTRNYEYSLL